MGSIPNGSAPLQACARQIFKLRYRAAPEGASSSIYMKLWKMLKLILLSVLIVYTCIQETSIILMMYLNNLYQHLILCQLLQNVINLIILEFQFKTHEKNIIIFCCDSNDNNVITFNYI